MVVEVTLKPDTDLGQDWIALLIHGMIIKKWEIHAYWNFSDREHRNFWRIAVNCKNFDIFEKKELVYIKEKFILFENLHLYNNAIYRKRLRITK